MTNITHVWVSNGYVFTGLEDPAAEASTLLEHETHEGITCKNKSCVRRGAMEDKLLARWEQVKTELGTKVKGLQKLRRLVRTQERADGRFQDFRIAT